MQRQAVVSSQEGRSQHYSKATRFYRFLLKYTGLGALAVIFVMLLSCCVRQLHI